MNYVIIGNSAAAVGCVEGIRSRDSEGNILLFASEPHHTYSRPLISYLLGKKTDEQKMRYRPGSFYEDNKVTPRLGTAVEEILPEQHRIRLENGEENPYDKLLVATGSVPFVPKLAGLDTVPRRFSFMTLDDAKALEKAVDNKTRVLILGAGLIGLKCAEGLRRRTEHITVVDRADHILPSILVKEAAEIVERHIAAQGVRLVLADSVARFSAGKAELASGGTLEFDVLVLAVGVRPNTALVEQAGGKVEKGIAVDAFCRTTLPDVYAAGDCTESLDVSTGQRRVLALLPGAYMQGECAGIHMAGGEKPYGKAIPMNAIGFFGLHMITAGSYEGETGVTASGDSFKQLVWRDNRLTGYIMLGDVARAGIYTSLIRDRVPLDTIDFDLIRERPQLMAFSRRERVKKLSGAYSEA